MEATLSPTSGEKAAEACRASCFHCSLPVPAGVDLSVTLLGEPRPMCCAGCEAVARTIVQAGLESYYETRETPVAGEVSAADLLPVALYDDPLAQRQFVASVGEHERESTLALEGIRCAACVWLNERYLRALPGVTRISVNYVTRRVQVAWDERAITLGAIIAAVRALGYDAYPFEAGKQRVRDGREQRSALWRLFVAGFGTMQVMMYAFPRYIDDLGTLSPEANQVMRWASLVLTLPVLLFSCGSFFSSAWADLRARRAGIDLPISLGILAGFGASVWATLTGSGEVYFDSITMLVFLLLASRYLEFSARRKATARLDHLARWMPSFAFRLQPGEAAAGTRIPAHELRRGDRVLVAPGEPFPADGVVMHGESSADESLLTGESRAVAKVPGARLIAGSVNLSQPITLEVTHAGLETQAAAIGRLIERAAAGKPRLVETADRIARSLTLLVLAVTAATLIGWALVDPPRALWAAVAVLMVTCPCALGLAAPIVLTSATGALAKRGIVLTRGAAIESLATVTDVVLDKTGTLTEGKLRLSRLEPLGARGQNECLALAQALESGSRHPVAQSLAAMHTAIDAPLCGEIRHFPGKGIEARTGERTLRIGTMDFVQALAGPAPALAPRPAGETTVFLGGDEGWLARLCFEDGLREGAAALVRDLQARGIEVHLLSGDDPRVVDEVAAALGISKHRGGAVPQDKFAYVRELQARGKRVAMVGDGLNDAPVLAKADVSIAMGQGAALAQQNADFVLASGQLGGVLVAGRIARRAMTAIRQNFLWALAYNALALPAAALGLIGPWGAAIGMAASSFVVVLNSARFMAAVR